MPLQAMEGGASSRSGAQGSIVPVVLCGGSGTRLWPLSRALHPKQLLPLAQSATMLEATVGRTASPLFAPPLVVTGEDHRFLVREQIAPGSGRGATIILEPCARNTAPAIALAAHWLEAVDPDTLMLVMPSDHVIADEEAFRAAVEMAMPAANAGRLVTFGIEPTRPEVGYGYIEAEAGSADSPGVRRVERFVEKPDLATAEAYCASGSHFWNGGIFLFRPSAFLDELRSFAPDLASACAAAVTGAVADGDFVRPAPGPFAACPAISIDYAVMERTKKAAVVPVSIGWSDVGSWQALWEITPKDERQNILHGDVVAVDSSGSLLRSEANLTVAAVGVRDLVVVATRDAVLIVPRERSQDTRLVVEALKAAGRDRHSAHPQVHRPWGSYETTDSGDRFQTKRIIVKPGEKLSLQLHHQRSEHWIVVSGTARVTVGDEVRLLQENESTYVPAGTVHRLENPGKIPLHLIEVQCGPYLGEDDIVRLDDSYGRLPKVA